MSRIDVAPGICLCGGHDGTVVVTESRPGWGEEDHDIVTHVRIPACEAADICRAIMEAAQHIDPEIDAGPALVERAAKDRTAAERQRRYRARRQASLDGES